MTWIACRWSRWSRTRSGSCCGLRCKGRVGRCARVWEWPCPRRCSRPRPPPRGRMLRMVPRRLIDALSLYYSGRCNILLSKMSLTAIRKRQVDPADRPKLDAAASAIGAVGDRLAFATDPHSLAAVASGASDHGADLVVLDYLQRVAPAGK